jgi:hypothetical protein
MSSEDSSSLSPSLDQAKKRLKTALDEACDADVDAADTGELIRVEEVLAIANDAAKQAVSVRRRLRSKQPVDRAKPAETPTSREVTDAGGVRWSVFAVHPSASSGRATLRAAFQGGWLAFDAGTQTRRLAPIPDGWESMSDRQLLALCETAEVAQRRRGSP